MKLAIHFRTTLAAMGVRLEPAESNQMEELLAALLARGRSAYPTLAVPDVDFIAALAQAAAHRGPKDPLATIKSLAIEDLYLARACVSMIPGAAELCEARCAARIRFAVAAATSSHDVRIEAEQRAKATLMVGEPDAPPKIASYDGQGPLDRWVGVVVQRLVTTIVRGEGAERKARDGAALEAALATGKPEVAYAKPRPRPEFEDALRNALSSLPERDRALLRLRLISGIEVERIGVMYGVSRPTVTRWLAAARDAVSAEVHRLLRQMRLSPGEVAPLARLLASELDIGISRVLAAAEDTIL